MANSHAEFQDYLEALNLSTTQEDRLRDSRNALIKKIKKYFADKGLTQPDDESQGSYILGTQNRPIEDNFDLDHGIYLKHYTDAENPTPTQAQDLIKDAVKGHTDQPLGEKDACVRVVYSKQGDTPGHHIDLAVYRVKGDGSKWFAHAKDCWQSSDQKAFKKWYDDNKTDQIHHLVRLFKGWADNNGGAGDQKLPSGFHLTVLAVKCAKPVKDRDDQAFVNTAAAIAARLKAAYQNMTGDKITRPVTPYEDLFKSYSPARMNACIQKFDKLVFEGTKALNEQDHTKAQKIWQSIFGGRFNITEKSKKQTEPYDKFPNVTIARSRDSA
jgi:hypothetical protein